MVRVEPPCAKLPDFTLNKADNRAQHEEYGNPSDQYQCQKNDDDAAEYPSTTLA